MLVQGKKSLSFLRLYSEKYKYLFLKERCFKENYQLLEGVCAQMNILFSATFQNVVLQKQKYSSIFGVFFLCGGKPTDENRDN